MKKPRSKQIREAFAKAQAAEAKTELETEYTNKKSHVRVKFPYAVPDKPRVVRVDEKGRPLS